MRGQIEMAWQRSPVLVTIAVTYVVLMAISYAMVLDPFVRHDDFPALLADPDGYYIKTKDEGRWINYLWHLRGFVIPSWLAFALYQLCWAIVAAAAAINMCGPKARAFYPIVIALFIVVAPPAMMISLWFNTLLPGLAIVAVYAVLMVRFGSRRMRPWLVLFVPATLMCYTSYPLLLLALCLTAHDTRWSFRNLLGLMVLFVASFALGLLTIYSLNFYAHGVFGIPMAQWRHPNPAHDLASAMENLPLVWNFMLRSMDQFAIEFAPMAYAQLGLMFFGMVLLLRSEGWPAVYIAMGLVAGLGLISLQIVRTGIVLSPRVNIFVWVLFAGMIARLAMMAQVRNPFGARILRNAMLLVVGSYGLYFANLYTRFPDWQAETRAMADAMRDGDGPIWISGSFESIPSAGKAAIQRERGLRLRLTYLTGRKVYFCGLDASDPHCATLPARPDNVERIAIVQNGADTLLLLPTVPAGQETSLAQNEVTE